MSTKSKLSVLVGVVVLLSSTFAAASPKTSTKTKSSEAMKSKWLDLSFGLAAGGPVGLLAPLEKVADGHSTTPFTTPLRMQARFPRISARVVELYALPLNGIGLNIRNDDLRLGGFKLHLLDVGVFYNVFRPVSVSRVERKLDLTFGIGMEYELTEKWSVTIDGRMFLPANVSKLLVDYGDFARLIGREAGQGVQTWVGLSYSWGWYSKPRASTRSPRTSSSSPVSPTWRLRSSSRSSSR